MIYSFKAEKDKTFIEYFNILENLCDFCFHDGVFYINTDLSTDIITDKIGNVKLIDVTYNSISELKSEMIKKWCNEIFYKEELKEFEKTPECQERLIEINNMLDILEKGGVSVGQTKEESSHTNRGEKAK